MWSEGCLTMCLSTLIFTLQATWKASNKHWFTSTMFSPFSASLRDEVTWGIVQHCCKRLLLTDTASLKMTAHKSACTKFTSTLQVHVHCTEGLYFAIMEVFILWGHKTHSNSQGWYFSSRSTPYCCMSDEESRNVTFESESSCVASPDEWELTCGLMFALASWASAWLTVSPVSLSLG